MTKNASALAIAIGATLGATGSADAATGIATLTSVTSYSNNGSSAANLTSSTATFEYDDATEVVTQTGGTYNARYTISPLTTLFRHLITGAVIGNGGAATASTYECVEGNFGGTVGANLCGNYNFGGNYVNESTLTYGPGTASSRTLGGDDMALGTEQTIANLNGMATVSYDGTTLVLSNAVDATPGGQNPDSGYRYEFAVTIVGARTAVDDTASTRLNVPVTIVALGNDVGFADPVTVSVTAAPDHSGTVVIQESGSDCADPCSGNAADITFVLTPSAPLNTTTYSEKFSYQIDDGTGSDTADVTVQVENAVPQAGDTTVSTEEGTPVDVDVGPPLTTLGDGTTSAHNFVLVSGDNCTVDDASHTVTYAPPPGFTGTASCDYSVADTDSESDIGTVTINVTAASGGNDGSGVSLSGGSSLGFVLLPLLGGALVRTRAKR